MLNGIHHVAFVVPDLDGAIEFLEKKLEVKLSERKRLGEDVGVEVAILWVGGTRIELIRPYKEESEYQEFLARTGGGLHHVAFAVSNIEQVAATMQERGIRLRTPKPQAAPLGWTVLNIDPSSTFSIVSQVAEG